MINTFVALDLETTGLDPKLDRIIEIGALKVVEGEIVDEFSTLINPRMTLPERITELTGITDDMLVGAPTIDAVLDDLFEFIGELPLLGHSITFDYSFIKCAAVVNKKTFEKEGIDTLRLARIVFAEAPSRRLSALCEMLGIDPGNSHRAVDDAKSAMELYRIMDERNTNPDLYEYFNSTQKLQFSIKKQSPITPAQVKYLKSLVAMHHITLEKEIESLTKSEASRKIDQILSTYGRSTSV